MDSKAEREEVLDTIIRILIEGRHVGWRNAIPMKDLARRCGVKPNQLRADSKNRQSRGLILEIRKTRGIPVLSYVTGYYLPDPRNKDEDYERHRRWTRGHGEGEQYSHSKSVKATRVAAEIPLFKDKQC